ncbi:MULTISPECIES: FixH family protein [Niastella]|uniref:FixH family protein n=1 Tax=Niastella soli TaxID=2821487 RepID=A0ABS3YVC8_9BACT|nr:FixH family protein [Niastella soli]MBO9201899.1 FixH family protein [Niastella soli]
MTLNWGHKLIGVFLIFVGSMSYLVYRCMNTNYDLVSKDYYKEELSYQQVIDGESRANQLGKKLSITQTGETVVLQLPNEMKNTAVKGTVWFYYAPNAARDRKIELAVNAAGEQSINSNFFQPGKYIVKVKWESSGKQYYAEEYLTIQ